MAKQAACSKDEFRKAYIYGTLPLDLLATQLGVSVRTARRWKKDALDQRDNWEKLKAANTMQDGTDAISRTLLIALLEQFQLSMDKLNNDEKIEPDARVELLSKLSDSFAKCTSSSKKLMPETNSLVVAMNIIQMLGEFISKHYPQHLAVFSEILEPFGKEVEKAYG